MIRFISVSDSGYQSHILANRRAIQSPAANVIHARAFLARAVAYHATKPTATYTQRLEPGLRAEDDENAGTPPAAGNSKRVGNAKGAVKNAVLTVPSPTIAMLGTARKDPFVTSSARFTSTEDMLLDH
ncbi:hypothetical protein TsFJ059_008006, partial [Trichoderma semiorbis]